VVETGGGGRANGFGGPCAPALSIAPADGDGGGNTTPGGPFSAFPFAGVEVLFPAESRDESAVALPPSEVSLGICTFNCGRLDGNGPLLVLDGGLIFGIGATGPPRGASVAALTGIVLEPEEVCGSDSSLREWLLWDS
jgi:hypothetical protein